MADAINIDSGTHQTGLVVMLVGYAHRHRYAGVIREQDFHQDGFIFFNLAG